MNYKETLFFIGKCLTINHEQHNKIIIENELKSKKTDWESIVKISTAHYVFPALYCNLKKAGFLFYLPEDLVEYMKHITDLNRERNEQIIEQAKEINQLLIENNITPIFLKGTGNLIEGLYDDFAERMLGDIDFLVSDKDYKKTIKVLENDGYLKDSTEIDTTFVNRHYPKIVKENRIGALEIHFKMVLEPYHKHFNYNYIKDDIKIVKNNISILSFKDQIILTSINKQINDRGHWYKSISLRASYDLFLLSKKASTINSLKNVPTLFLKLNNFIASTYFLFNKPQSLVFEETKNTKKYLEKQSSFLSEPKKNVQNRKKWDLYFLTKSRVLILIRMFYNKKNLRYVIQRSLKK